MSKLRGDEDLFALMDELSSAQGYEQKAPEEEQESEATETRPAKRRRLCPDVPEYPSNKPAGSQSIWNPYVQVNNNNNNGSRKTAETRCLAPTNPQVEVFRRRAYERFKEQIKQIFERADANSTKTGVANLWKDLQVVSLMERWHFAVKLRETQRLDQTQPLEQITSSLEWETHQVDAYIQQASNLTSNQQGWVDPILISEPAKAKKGQVQPENLLLGELKFEWIRAWRRTVQGKDKDQEAQPVFESKKFRNKSSTLARAVRAAGYEAMATFRKDIMKRTQLETMLSNKKRRNMPKLVHHEEDVIVSFSGLTFSINHEHFDKLRIMFDRQNQTSQSREEHEAGFVSSLFSLLARYDMLQGAGLQAAIQGAVFDVLLKHYACNVECFASPLNCRYERFLSAFPDTDATFGSLGSFFDHNFMQGGSYQANPPFVSSFIHAMYTTMDQSLSQCKEPLMFVVFIPAWIETSGWKALKEAKHLQRYVLLDQASHYYTEGTQHRRKTSSRIASFDTSVFFLQNDAGKEKWKVDDSHVEELKQAFSLETGSGE